MALPSEEEGSFTEMLKALSAEKSQLVKFLFLDNMWELNFLAIFSLLRA